jgi:hypothetical protein
VKIICTHLNIRNRVGLLKSKRLLERISSGHLAGSNFIGLLFSILPGHEA